MYLLDTNIVSADAPAKRKVGLEAFADWVREQLTKWLATVLPSGAEPEVTLHGGVDANGMSSETIPLSVSHTVDGALVALERQ